ncbi:MAG: type II secretion system protein [Acidobacteria bacterium]|nr:type II secretion system protein [Acidobacteriota bacterium]
MKAFTLVEMMVVVIIILILTGATALMLANGSDSAQVRRDGTACVAFLRNMWDVSKAHSEPIVLIPNFEEGTLSYIEPKSGVQAKAHFFSKAKVLGILVNDRLIHSQSEDVAPVEETEDEQVDSVANGIYLSEGRGLSRVGIVLGVPKEESFKLMTLSRLNLITGRSEIIDLEPEQWFEMLDEAEAQSEAPL